MRIGVFDSGVGGLTVLTDLVYKNPFAHYFYVADTAHLPYGEKTPEQIIEYSRTITQYLITAHQVSHIVIACHTSSAIAYNTLVYEFPTVHFTSVINTTVQACITASHTGRIGVLATQASISSHRHREIFFSYNPALTIIEQACPALVPLIEAPIIDQQAIIEAVNIYCAPLKTARVDTVLLGCTHYDIIRSYIQKYMGETCAVIGAQQQHNYTQKITPSIFYFATKDPQIFSNSAHTILPKELSPISTSLVIL